MNAASWNIWNHKVVVSKGQYYMSCQSLKTVILPQDAFLPTEQIHVSEYTYTLYGK